jgi:hypothetical protein
MLEGLDRVPDIRKQAKELSEQTSQRRRQIRIYLGRCIFKVYVLEARGTIGVSGRYKGNACASPNPNGLDEIFLHYNLRRLNTLDRFWEGKAF